MNTKEHNLKLYPAYRCLSMDLILFYTINIVFLIEIKKFAMPYVVLSETMYTLFVVIFQFFAAKVIEKIGAVKSSVIANVFNAIYLIIFMICKSPWQLYVGEAFCALAFAIKDVSDTVILNESIETSKSEKSKQLASIQAKAVSGYYLINSVTLIFSGLLFKLNPYIPFIISFIICLVTVFQASRFKDVDENKNKEEEDDKETNDTVSLLEAFKYVFKSKRTLSIILYSALANSVLIILITYETALLEELNTSPIYIGFLFALLNFVSAIASKAQMAFQMKYRNKTLTAISVVFCLVILLSGIIASININPILSIALISILYIFKYAACGLVKVFIVKYVSNFTNEKIDTQLYTIKGLVDSVASTVLGFVAAGLVAKLSVANSFIIYGLITSVMFALMLSYMNKNFGLKPEEYSDIDVMYDKK